MTEGSDGDGLACHVSNDFFTFNWNLISKSTFFL